MQSFTSIGQTAFFEYSAAVFRLFCKADRALLYGGATLIASYIAKVGNSINEEKCMPCMEG